jgi:hypothetical protein
MVLGHQHQVFQLCLSDQKAIKRVVAMQRKRPCRIGMLRRYCERLKATIANGLIEISQTLAALTTILFWGSATASAHPRPSGRDPCSTR